jgi:hypothetical protein
MFDDEPRLTLEWPGSEDEGGDPSGSEPELDPISGRHLADGSPAEPAEVVAPIERARPAAGDGLPGPSVTVLIDAYERLGTRVLSRLRDLRTDVDGDLAQVRSELSSLQTAVEDVADRVQLRQMRSSIDDLRSDVANLRRAVLEWPELERMAGDVSALRSANAEVLEAVKRPAVAAAPKKGSAADARPEPVDLTGIEDALAEMRAEVVALRRRVTLRVGEGGKLSPEELDAIAEVVTAKLLERIRPA